MAQSLHLVDDDGQLVGETQLRDFLARIVANDNNNNKNNDDTDRTTPHDATTTASAVQALQRVGTSYHVVGVFGGQSSGKSTLLNCLFGTQFQTLDAAVRRGQTTKGAFLARANVANTTATTRPTTPSVDAGAAFAHDETDEADAAATTTKATSTPAASATPPPLLVVDFEGTDGLEHGDNQSFERQLSLFALCMADTLIINLWAVDVGRFNAANLGLLRTIFEVNLQLFAHADTHNNNSNNNNNSAVMERPTLLVVVRDFVDEHAAPTLATLERSFAAIWDSIARTGRYADARLDALFDVCYVTLPHYKLQRDAFDRAVTALRRRFVDAHAPAYLFHAATTCRSVPLDGLPRYLGSCWRAIQASKDLDIPTQREMLAQHRCSEVRTHELRVFASACAALSRRIDRGDAPVALVRVAALQREVDARMAAYAAQTRLYTLSVANAHAQQLRAALLEAAVVVLRRWCERVAAQHVLPSLETRLHAAVDDALTHALHAAQRLPFVRDAATRREQQPPRDDKADGSVDAARATDASNNASSLSTETAAAAAWHGGAYGMDDAACQRVVRAFYATLAAAVAAMMRDVCAQPPSLALYTPHDAAVLLAADEADDEEDGDGGGHASAHHDKRNNDNNDDSNTRAHTTVLRTLLASLVVRAVYARLRSRLAAMADTAADVMHRGFERCLTHKDDGTTRYFATVAGLEAALPAAQQAGLVLLGCLFCMRLRLRCAAALDGAQRGDTDVTTIAARVLQCEQPCAVVLVDDDDDDDDDNTAAGDTRRQAQALQQAMRRCVLHFVALDVPPVYPHIAAATAATATAAQTQTQLHKDDDDDKRSHDDGRDTATTVNETRGDDDDDNNNKTDADTATTTTTTTTTVASLLLMRAEAVRHAYTTYRAQCDYTAQMQLRMLHASRPRLPAWVLPALLVLGWNELMYVLTHPLLLVVLLLLCGVLGQAMLTAQWHAMLETMPSAVAVPARAAAAYVHTMWHQLLGSAATLLAEPAASTAATAAAAATPPPSLSSAAEQSDAATRSHGHVDANATLRRRRHDSDGDNNGSQHS